MKKERIFYLDLIRALCVMIITTYHFNLLINRENFLISGKLIEKYANGDFGQFGVVLFFMISGAALMYTYEEHLELKEYFVKRIIGIFPMFYISYIVASFCLFFINRSITHTAPKWTYILTILGMDGYLNKVIENNYLLGTWFLGCIILIYLCFPLLRRLLIKYPKLSIIFIIVYYIIFIENYSMQIKMECNFLSRIPDFFLGMYFMYVIKKVNLREFILAIIFAVVIFVNPLAINRIYKVTVMGGAMFYILVYISQIINNNKIKNIVSIFSKYSFSIFLVHLVVLKQVLNYFKGKSYTLMEIMYIYIIYLGIIFIFAIPIEKISKKLSSFLLDKAKKGGIIS